MNPVIQARTIYFPAELHSSFPASRHTASSKTQSAAMAHTLPRFLSRRLWQQSSSFSRYSNPLRENFQAQFRNTITRRSYATGESGPNPRPGQSPFKVWPFIAIAVAGSGAYVLMVRSRLGMCQSLFQFHIIPFKAPIRESRFVLPTFQNTLQDSFSSLSTTIILQKNIVLT
jgi:hypothetical protein